MILVLQKNYLNIIYTDLTVYLIDINLLKYKLMQCIIWNNMKMMINVKNI